MHILKTERLVLRLVELGDSADLFAIWSDPEVTQYMNISEFSSLRQAEEMIQFFIELEKQFAGCRYGIILDDKVIGSIGFNYLDYQNKRTEIGYELASDYWGQGYASEAMTAVIAAAFNELKLIRIEAKIHPNNKASQRLVEKFDFQQEGLLRKYEKTLIGFDDLYLYSLINVNYQPI